MTSPAEPQRSLIALANRLPVQQVEGQWELSPGGLVTALRPIMVSRQGAWVGWDGSTDAAGGDPEVPRRLPGLSIDLHGIGLSAAEVRDHYHGFCNRTLWPLLHDAVEKPIFDRAWWQSYQRVNQRFADAALEALAEHPDALLWVQDYHLMLVPDLVRRASPRQRIGFFLHVPWPDPNIFARLPWRAEVLRGLLGADVVSFHTERYRRSFVRSCARLLDPDEVDIKARDIVTADHTARTTAGPISIDAHDLAQLARRPTVRAELATLEEQFQGRTVLLGVDRLDYTKGIIERLLAIEDLLTRRPDLSGRLVFLQVAVPSRDDVAEYQALRVGVEQLVGRINGRFTQPGADVPVHYLYRSLGPEQLAAFYAVADVLLVTPLMDGMNLVAKEFVTVQHSLRRAGALLLSEFTGAVEELRGAIVCNPFDVEGMSRQVERALELPETERRARLGAMAARVRSHDVHRWVDRQIADLAG